MIVTRHIINANKSVENQLNGRLGQKSLSIGMYHVISASIFSVIDARASFESYCNGFLFMHIVASRILRVRKLGCFCKT